MLTTITFPGVAGAQTASRVVVPVTGELSDGGTFEGRIVNPDVSYGSATDTLRIGGILADMVTKADGTTEKVRQQFTTNLRGRSSRAHVRSSSSTLVVSTSTCSGW